MHTDSIVSVEVLTLFFSVVAIIISLVTFFLQKKQTMLENQPHCSIKITSIGEKLAIRFENVGIGVMMVDKVEYKNSAIQYTIDFSRFFEDVACRTRSEERINGDSIFPQSKYNLLTLTFNRQTDLVAAWNVIKDITVRVTYHSVYNKKAKKPIEFSLEREYDTFMSALGNRELECFATKKTISIVSAPVTNRGADVFRFFAYSCGIDRRFWFCPRQSCRTHGCSSSFDSWFQNNTAKKATQEKCDGKGAFRQNHENIRPVNGNNAH